MRAPLRALGTALLLSWFAAPAGAAEGPFDPRAVDALAKHALQTWHVPGVAVAIVRDGEVVYLKGHGVRDVATGEPVTPDTVFPLASCTKAFTTAALAVLVDEGKLGWDDPVRRHLPSFRLGDPLADRDVRIRDLLCHRTGLRGHDLLWYRAPWAPEETVRRAGLLPLDRPFRSAFQYQSTMFTAAGLAVGSASGTPWDAFLRERLLGPLGMKNTACTSTDATKAADRATGHRLNERGEPEPVPYYPQPVPDAAGSVHSTARDLARWVRFQLGDGTAGGKRLVSAASLTETHRPQMVVRLEGSDRAMHPDTVQMSYGLGWVIQDYRGRRLVSHAGAVDGFRCHLTMVPDAHLGIVLLCNLQHTRMNLALSNRIVDRLLGLPARDWDRLFLDVARQEAAAERERARQARRHAGTRPSKELAAYAGDYEHPAYGTVRVTLERGKLVWDWRDFHAALEHFHYDTFTLPVEFLGNPEVQFTLNEAGGVERMHVFGHMDIEFRRVAGAKR
jgi:CubicO group peptidase (beta-lactamase class C family)